MNTPSLNEELEPSHPITFVLPTSRVIVTVDDLEAIRRAVVAYLEQRHAAMARVKLAPPLAEQTALTELRQAEPFTLDSQVAHIGAWRLEWRGQPWQLVRQPASSQTGALRQILSMFTLRRDAPTRWHVEGTGSLRLHRSPPRPSGMD